MSERPRPRHTPYAGRHGPFSIAMAPVTHETWLEIDENLAAEIREKQAIFAAEPEAFMAEPGTQAAQEEAAALIAAHLRGRGFAVPAGGDGPPLLRAALAVQDDLVLMRRGDDGLWRLAAAALAFPSSWSLAEKFGRPMDEIHEDVPGWDGPMASRVHRIFDGLAPLAPVARHNWSIQFGGGLRQAVSKHAPRAPADPAAPILVRVERQTLMKLPVSGDILFTIKVMLDPIEAFAQHPDGPALARHLAARLEALTAPQLSYKTLSVDRARVVRALSELGAQGS